VQLSALEHRNHELEAAHAALQSQLETERSARAIREREHEAELAAASAARGAANEAVTAVQHKIATLQREMQSVQADCDGQLTQTRQVARDAQSKAAAHAETVAHLEQQIRDLHAQHEASVSDLEQQLAERMASSTSAEAPAEGESSAEVDGLRQSVKELSEQVHRYAEAAERLTIELDEAHAASASLEEQVRCPYVRQMRRRDWLVFNGCDRHSRSSASSPHNSAMKHDPATPRVQTSDGCTLTVSDCRNPVKWQGVTRGFAALTISCGRRQMVEMEAANAELEDNNTRLEAAALKTAEQAAEVASLRAALTAREQQHSALKVHNQRRFLFCPVRNFFRTSVFAEIFVLECKQVTASEPVRDSMWELC
jgi:predicted  nucleic acid-binding Zn-ribbon protein